MRVAIIDADLLGRRRHRFPNLASMKLAGFHKDAGDDVVLKLDYDSLENFDRVYISKVFTSTRIPESSLNLDNVICGGTGFFYDKAPPLPAEVEHHMPDYHLYDGWVVEQIANGGKPLEYRFYTDYSIGFLTRGCFRKCAFCVNRNYERSTAHSPLSEFYDPARPKICLLDDNFFAFAGWKALLAELKQKDHPFLFKQGMDERLMTDERCRDLFQCRYDGAYIFAFDDLNDAAVIEEKLTLLHRYTKSVLMFYCFTAYDRENHWDEEFWRQDIFDLLQRIEILMRNRVLPYVMRYERYKTSPYRGMYITIARWCNQPSLFKKKSLREFAAMPSNSSSARYLAAFESRFPEAAPFLDMRYDGLV